MAADRCFFLSVSGDEVDQRGQIWSESLENWKLNEIIHQSRWAPVLCFFFQPRTWDIAGITVTFKFDVSLM